MGLSAIPLLIVGGALETVSERLRELPVVLLSLGWVMPGLALWHAAKARSTTAVFAPLTVTPRVRHLRRRR